MVRLVCLTDWIKSKFKSGNNQQYYISIMNSLGVCVYVCGRVYRWRWYTFSKRFAMHSWFSDCWKRKLELFQSKMKANKIRWKWNVAHRKLWLTSVISGCNSIRWKLNFRWIRFVWQFPCRIIDSWHSCWDRNDQETVVAGGRWPSTWLKFLFEKIPAK